MDFNKLFWLLPILLVVYSIYKVFENRNAQSGEKSNRKLLIFCFLLVGLAIGGLFLFKRSSKKEGIDVNKIVMTVGNNCLTAASPEELADMLNHNEDYIAGIFYEKGFKRLKSETGCNYVLLDPQRLSYSDEYILEKAYILNKFPGWICYALKSREKYNSFFSYLKSLNTDSLDTRRYLNAAKLTEGYPAYRYKNCIYIDRGFSNEYVSEAYTIKCFRSDLLDTTSQARTSKKTQTVVPNDCLTGRESYLFGYTGTYYIRFLNRNGNILEFTGTLDWKTVKGSVIIEGNRMQVIAESGNSQGKFTLLNNCQTLMIDVTSWENSVATKHNLELTRAE